ncbi:hypothetical protein A3C89_04015 [Candidatus Kaiserbacteria bacterium RIFCSPHIGHO2_02_FULL_50_50]|uniref:Uncharacterized protein n=1 Tax=Candidatus Kaiserbacteria bacterium RIFCSPHIGHO2_02_FULL_50_50 TaxID=1798492 RepID=A0A1F6DGG7_9BACT|nr:MAG: hypothetical protein A3C89_04015 [Candidatus Kaiserbacteria bacterium RIFCSPHIGHO2_02_FULL_50_50]OGG89344.1 MAG: hypothetical protein A3G62_02305 [Candidatus Kaiserbacteria bacterium RIFCSPLOWO2_12_FULL_50_10]
MHENPHQAQPMRQKKRGGINNKALLGILVVVVVGAAAYFKPWERTSITTGTTSPADIQIGSTTKEAKDLLDELGDIYAVPANDEPVLYTIDDAAALIAQQAFFTGSQNGDTLFIFPKSMKAVIFSQERNKVINAGPLSYEGDQSVTTGVTPTEAPTPTSSDAQ